MSVVEGCSLSGVPLYKNEKYMDLHCNLASHSFASGILNVRKLLNMGIRLGLGLGKDSFHNLL